MDATAKLFAEKGGSVRRPPQDIPEIGRFAVVADPSGAVLCIMTPLPMETGGFPQETQNLPGHVGWYELATNNVDDAIAFTVRSSAGPRTMILTWAQKWARIASSPITARSSAA